MLAVAVAVCGLAVASPARAEPGSAGDDGEGGSKSLVQQLEAASRGYVEAKEALDRSRKRQSELTAALRQLDAELGPRQAALDQIVQQAYRSGRLGPMSALITADSAGGFLDRAETLQTIAVRQDAALRELKATRE